MRRTLTGALLAAALCALSARADDLSLEDAFERTAAATGHVYQAGRDLLVAQRSEQAIAFLRERAGSENPREALLAKALLVRIDLPEQAQAVRDGILTWHPEISRRHPDVDQAVLRFQRKDVHGRHIETREVTISPHTAPLVADVLYEAGGAVQGIQLRNAVKAAGSMRDPTLVDASIHAVGPWTDYQMREEAGNALALFGPVAAPPLRAVIAGPDLEDRRANARLTQRRVYAARALATIGDAESVPLLAERLRALRDDDLALEYAKALAMLDPAEAAPILFDHLVRIAELRRDGRGPFSVSSDVQYERLRPVLLGLGDAARAELDRTTDRTFGAELILTSLRWELTETDAAEAFFAQVGRTTKRASWLPYEDEPSAAEAGRELFWRGYHQGPPEIRATDVPRAILHEVAWLAQRVDYMAHLARSTDPVEREIAVRTLTTTWLRRPPREVLVALAERPGRATIDACRQIVASKEASDLGPIVEALLLRGDEEGIEVLDAIVAGAPEEPFTSVDHVHALAAPLARAVRAVLAGETDVAELLPHESPAIRLAAARVLARRGDARGGSILFAAALEPGGGDYDSLRDDLVRSGYAHEPAADADERPNVLTAAIALRRAEPEAASAVDRALVRAYPSNGSILGPQVHDFIAAGERAASDVGRNMRPLLEEHALLGASNRVALFALAALADERSIPVVLRVARRGDNDAAEALKLFGPTGIAAAATVPPPNPELPEYRGRAGRHVVATEALGEEEAGLPKLLEGFREAQPGREDRKAFDQWRERQIRYLKIAATRSDPELLEPTLALLDAHGRDEYLRDAVFRVLVKQHDDRIPPRCATWLSFRSNRESIVRRVLAIQLGPAASEYLLETARSIEAPQPHQVLLHNAVKLAVGTKVPVEVRSQIADALRPLLRHESKKIRDAASYDLLTLHLKRPAAERNDVDRAAVIEYVKTEREPNHMVAGELTRHRLEGAAEAILTAYRNFQSRGLLADLAALELFEAAPDVIEKMNAHLAERKLNPKPPQFGYYELQVLPRLGPLGREYVVALLTSDAPLDIRGEAAAACSQVDLAEAFDGTLAILAEFVARDERGDLEKRMVRGLPHTLAKLDPRRAHAELTRMLVDATDPMLIEGLSHARSWVRQTHPEVIDAQAELDRE